MDDAGRFNWETFLVNVVDFDEGEFGEPAGFSPIGIQSYNAIDLYLDRVIITTILSAKYHHVGDNVYNIGPYPILINLHFNRRVIYEGGYIRLKQGNHDFVANYDSGSGTRTLTFAFRPPSHNTLPLNGYEPIKILGWGGQVKIHDGTEISTIKMLLYPSSLYNDYYELKAGERWNGSLYAPPVVYFDPSKSINAPLPNELRDDSGRRFSVENIPPRITNIRTNMASGTYVPGEVVLIALDFDETVKYAGYNELRLNIKNGANDYVITEQSKVNQSDKIRSGLAGPDGNFFRPPYTDNKFVAGYLIEFGDYTTEDIRVLALEGGNFEDLCGNRLINELPYGDGTIYKGSDRQESVNIRIVTDSVKLL